MPVAHVRQRETDGGREMEEYVLRPGEKATALIVSRERER